jgi:putative PIN family toxin of toxin-antitoxin system
MPIIAVLDTNIWVSAFLNPLGFPARLVKAGRDGHFTIVSSLPLLDELQGVLMRPRIMKIRQYTQTEFETCVANVGAVVQLVPVSGELRLCRDHDDDIVLETALRGNATYVVSRDEDLTRDLDLTDRLRERGVKTVTVQRFMDELGSKDLTAEVDG